LKKIAYIPRYSNFKKKERNDKEPRKKQNEAYFTRWRPRPEVGKLFSGESV